MISDVRDFAFQKLEATAWNAYDPWLGSFQ